VYVVLDYDLYAEMRVIADREGRQNQQHARHRLLDPGHEPAAPETELLLMFAARAQHVRETIGPALERGAWVLCDRFTDSSYAYQGGGRGLDHALIETLERAAVGLRPGLTILLDLDVATGRERTLGRDLVPDRIERERDGFFERVRAAYRERAAAEPCRFRVIDAAQPAQAVADAALAALKAWRAAG